MSITRKKDYPDGYPDDALQVIRSMSFTDGKEVNIVGSMSLRSQIYAGDYDAFETVPTHGSTEQAVRDLVRKFKQIIKQIEAIPNTYISDIKTGSVEEWKLIFEPYNHTKSLEQLETLFKDNIISSSTYHEGKKRIKPRVTKLEYLMLQRDFRPNVIRWTSREVLLGFKRLQDGRKFTLEEAFQTPIITKLDVIAWVQNNRYTDFSIIYQFKHKTKTLNPGFKDLELSIRENIFVLYREGNFYKMAKRMFSLAKVKGYTPILEKLSILFNGDVGRLYMVYGDIGTIESLLDLRQPISNTKLDFEIDQFKGRLSNISLEKYVHHEHELFQLIEKLLNMRTPNRETMKDVLGKIKTILNDIMSSYTKSYLLKEKLMPNY
jgi:hypothetical protein